MIKIESPSMRREWIEMPWLYTQDSEAESLPPCGGSGLKYYLQSAPKEITKVSLHAEGVD